MAAATTAAQKAAETRAARKLATVREALAFALAHGWEPTPGKANSLRRTTEHATPERIPKNWWPGKTYTSVEFVDFRVFDGGAKITAFYNTTRCPWVARSDRKVSLVAALAVLNNPELSDVHQNH